MEAVASIMKSGVFAELVGGMGNGLQDGSLDLGKLMGTVQTMVTSLSGDAAGSGKEGENPMELISTMMGSINAGAKSGEGDDAPAPDLGGMMNMVGPMLGALSSAGGGGAPTGVTGIEAQVDAQVAEARKKGVLPAITEVTDEKK